MGKTEAQERGTEGENRAVAFLKGLGYRVIKRNFTYGKLELDIVAMDGDELVFVEVKTRKSDRFGQPEEALNGSKQALLRRAADAYFQICVKTLTRCRFDVIAIVVNDGEWRIKHIKNAFT